MIPARRALALADFAPVGPLHAARLDAYAAGYRAARTVPSASLPDLADALLAEWLSGWRAGSAGA